MPWYDLPHVRDARFTRGRGPGVFRAERRVTQADVAYPTVTRVYVSRALSTTAATDEEE